MEEGQGAQHDFIAAEGGEPGGDMLDLLAQVAVGQHDTFGYPGGAAGILIHGHIIKDRRLRRIGGKLRQQAFPFIQIVCRLDIGGQPFFLAHQRKKQVLGEGEVVADTGVDNLFDLCFGPKIDHPVAKQIQVISTFAPESLNWCSSSRSEYKRVVHDGDGADAHDGIIGHHARDHVGQQDGHTVSLFDPEIRQARGESVHHVVQLGEAYRYP
jgi:hypothetical protein